MPEKHAWSLKIRSKIALGYVIILLMLGLFLVIVSNRISDLEQETVFLSDHDIEVHELTYQIEKNVLDMETGQRGFALTGDGSYLAPYNSGLVEWRINVAKLSGLIVDNPDQIRNLENIKGNIEKWVNEAGQYVVDLKKNGRNAEVNAFFRNDTGKIVIDAIRTQSDYFRDVERSLTNERISNLKDSNQKLLTTMYILWGFVAGLALLITYLLSASIVNPLHNVIQAINSIANGGNRSDRITVKTFDEIYELGEATNGLLDTVQRDQWTSEQLASMSMALQETTDMSSLCQIFVSRLSVMVEMQYAALFVLNQDKLYERMYTYAGAENKEARPGTDIIHLGEGLVGQCALDQRLNIVEQLPDHYIQIASGLGRTAPRFAVIAPIIFESKTVAVLEVAALTRWAPYHFALLNELLQLMGVTVNSVMTRMEIQRLLHESQVMNEELQVQSEELQVQSEELQVQTEELQNQTSELLTVNKELEDQKSVAENAAVELERYNEQLELSSRYKSEFLANMSHELRTPLNSMLILSQLLTENRNHTLSEEEQGYASVIYNSGSDLLGMINDILDLSKVEAGKMLVEMDAVNLTELPSLLQGYFGKQAEGQSLDFTVALGEEVPDLFFTDEMRLHQILRNLLSNAFKFTHQGSVTVDIRKLDAYSDPYYLINEPVLAFAVTDTGIGISAENRELIFEAFRQADGTTARKFGGTGLGLSISLQLAKLLGGHIGLVSEEGAGSTFTLYLPLREEDFELEPISLPLSGLTQLGQVQAAASVELENPAAEDQAVERGALQFEKEYAKLHGRTVLIVDDDSRNIFALEQGLEPYGMNILTAQTGYECLQIVREQPDLDIVLLDIMMPNLDGYDTLSIIREELLLPDLPIIAISAKTMKDDRERCFAAGATDFMSKPVNLQNVVSRMYRWIRDKG
ncbi:CHASE3 domain-containing protein [Paenibacillus sp. MMS20-IR301]|uniref:CHASE3 domain-containing protein n=1 Tax=Paenibacillus sp. MMS20-IR301 TaxID=2895946 RepID=UPI0028E41F54|nr:CHASE3 domain-containing protein [Paenibacillus sp. MMS20-IR301]WNS45502.1 CHASE3 domain-containing protein [Paenibacillus sp. MMS20-IR301]